jgi:DNA-directed RNA polymerase subunit RPC12/RpoP
VLSCSCGREFRTKQVGVRVVQQFDDGTPYKLFSADVLACPGCGHEILRWADKPIAEHFEPEFTLLINHGSPLPEYEARR